jgi:hypothetical protein
MVVLLGSVLDLSQAKHTDAAAASRRANWRSIGTKTRACVTKA